MKFLKLIPLFLIVAAWGCGEQTQTVDMNGDGSTGKVTKDAASGNELGEKSSVSSE